MIHTPTLEETIAINESKNGAPTGVYDASQALKLTLETMEQRSAAIADDRAISKVFGLKQLDDFTVPFWPGDYTFTIGLPSNGKSFLTRMIMLRIVNMLISGGHTDRAVVWITTEESVERVTTAWISAITQVSSTEMLSGKLNQVHSAAINKAVSQVASWPIYIIGHTLGNHHGNKRHTSARMSTAEMEEGMDFIANELGKEIIYTNLDYLQRVKMLPGVNNREEHIRLTIDWGRDMAHKFSTTFNMVTQSKFEVSKREYPVPTLEDSEWSANAGQSADTMISVSMPQTWKYGVGSTMPSGPYAGMVIKKGMMIIFFAKQKMGNAHESFLVQVKPDMMEWEMLEAVKENLNPGATKRNQNEDSYYQNTWESQEIPFGGYND